MRGVRKSVNGVRVLSVIANERSECGNPFLLATRVLPITRYRARLPRRLLPSRNDGYVTMRALSVITRSEATR